MISGQLKGNEFYKNTELVNLSVTVDGVLYIEKWMPIKGFEKEYSISSFGRVKSMERHNLCNGMWRKRKTQIIKPIVYDSGYLRFNLSVSKKRKIMSIHRIVADHFLPNPKNKPQVNHKLGHNKRDNSIFNLEWATRSENISHAYKNNLITNGKKLSDDQAIEIFNSKLTNRVLSIKHNVSVITIINIKNGKVYKKATSQTK